MSNIYPIMGKPGQFTPRAAGTQNLTAFGLASIICANHCNSLTDAVYGLSMSSATSNCPTYLLTDFSSRRSRRRSSSPLCLQHHTYYCTTIETKPSPSNSERYPVRPENIHELAHRKCRYGPRSKTYRAWQRYQ